MKKVKYIFGSVTLVILVVCLSLVNYADLSWDTNKDVYILILPLLSILITISCSILFTPNKQTAQ